MRQKTEGKGQATLVEYEEATTKPYRLNAFSSQHKHLCERGTYEIQVFLRVRLCLPVCLCLCVYAVFARRRVHVKIQTNQKKKKNVIERER